MYIGSESARRDHENGYDIVGTIPTHEDNEAYRERVRISGERLSHARACGRGAEYLQAWITAGRPAEGIDLPE